uniref:Secreted protein n=1 Tax=Setaria viridis TaxID=4556 RepID=A0A4U6T0P1_SETVI|nr:hypothetical protein SEVIR_9G334533v2 [Setaria viridis]
MFVSHFFILFSCIRSYSCSLVLSARVIRCDYSSICPETSVLQTRIPSGFPTICVSCY